MYKTTQFIYPAVFMQGENQVAVSFPDINLTTDGDTFEEAFLFAKDYLRIFCTYAMKYDLEIPTPSNFAEFSAKNALNNPMLIDTIIKPEDI